MRWQSYMPSLKVYSLCKHNMKQKKYGRRQWLRNLFIYMPHVVLSPDYDRETEPAADEIIKCCRFCFCDIKSKMGYKFHDYLILF